MDKSARAGDRLRLEDGRLVAVVRKMKHGVVVIDGDGKMGVVGWTAMKRAVEVEQGKKKIG